MRKENLNNTIVINESIPDEISKMKQQAGKNILIFGSPSVSQLLMQYNLIDDYWIFINPVILGKGVPYLQIQKTKQNLNSRLQNNFQMEKLH
jgi:dihydrofolate reductase